MAYDISNQKWETLIQAGNNDLQSSFLRNDSLFFVSSSSGTDNIFLRKPDSSISPVTKSRFGINDLTINGLLLLFTDYSSTGSNISYSTLPSVPYEDKIKDRSSSLLINRFPKTDVRSADQINNSYNPVPYRKWQHLFRFHSWMPFYADIEEVKDDPASIKPGFTLMTQNNLSTLISSVGYEYSDERHKIHSRIKWLGWPVVIESQMDYGTVPSVYKSRDSISDPDHVRQGMLFRNTISLPLSFSTGRFSQYLYLAGTSVYQNNYIHIRESGKYDYGQLQLTGRLYFSNYHRSSLRDIHPRWAQVIDLSHSFYPFDKVLYGNISTVKTAFYFPGILKNNGLKLRAEAERQNTEKFLLSNRASFSRSYETIVSEKVEFGSIDYYMPLFYPDFNISSFVYLKRIRTNLFYDITRGTGNYIFNYTENGRTTTYHDYSEIFNSFGFELMTDFYALRIPFMISAGVQSAWREFGGFPHLRLLFNIDLFGMSIGKTRL